jgi:hypothetical protein
VSRLVAIACAAPLLSCGGEPRETAAKVQGDRHTETRSVFQRDVSRLVAEPQPNGLTKVRLSGQFQPGLVARRALDGKMEVGCVESEAAVQHWLGENQGNGAVHSGDDPQRGSHE